MTECLDKTGLLDLGGNAPQGQSSQVQARDPALSALLRSSDVFRRKIQTHRLIQKGRGLIARESHVGGAEFEQFVPCAQPGQE